MQQTFHQCWSHDVFLQQHKIWAAQGDVVEAPDAVDKEDMLLDTAVLGVDLMLVGEDDDDPPRPEVGELQKSAGLKAGPGLRPVGSFDQGKRSTSCTLSLLLVCLF